MQTIEALVVRAGGCQPGDITGAQTRREAALREQRDALARAQTAFQEAQLGEGEDRAKRPRPLPPRSLAPRTTWAVSARCASR